VQNIRKVPIERMNDSPASFRHSLEILNVILDRIFVRFKIQNESRNSNRIPTHIQITNNLIPIEFLNVKRNRTVSRGVIPGIMAEEKKRFFDCKTPVRIHAGPEMIMKGKS